MAKTSKPPNIKQRIFMLSSQRCRRFHITWQVIFRDSINLKQWSCLLLHMFFLHMNLYAFQSWSSRMKLQRCSQQDQNLQQIQSPETLAWRSQKRLQSKSYGAGRFPSSWWNVCLNSKCMSSLLIKICKSIYKSTKHPSRAIPFLKWQHLAARQQLPELLPCRTGFSERNLSNCRKTKGVTIHNQLIFSLCKMRQWDWFFP